MAIAINVGKIVKKGTSVKNNESWDKLQAFYTHVVVSYVNVTEVSREFGNNAKLLSKLNFNPYPAIV
jgi:hypothetical protein